MKNVNDNKGITLIALIITIVVLLIIASISISGAIQGIDQADDNRAISDLAKVQQAITQRYTKYELTKDKSLLVGTKIDNSSLTGVPNTVNWKVIQFTTASETSTHPERKYYRLSKSDLENLGLTGDYQGSSYVVNYYSGEVYDEGQVQTSDGNALYKTAIENEASEFGDDIIKDGLLVYYDAINNTGTGHSNNTTIWRDLSGNGNDATLYGFDGTNPEDSGWRSNYLAFDGTNDWAKTVKEVHYKDSKEMTIQLTDIDGGLSKKDSIQVIVESSSNWNNNANSFGISSNEGKGIHDFRLTFHSSGTSYNIKYTNNSIILDGKFDVYTFVLNMNNDYNDYMEIYKNGELVEINTHSNYSANISNNKINNYIMYIGNREGTEFYTKMNMANFKVYNKALSEEEIHHNYILDKARYGIEE